MTRFGLLICLASMLLVLATLFLIASWVLA